MAKKATDINKLNQEELACLIPKLAKELPHRFINSALPIARSVIKDFIHASVRLAKQERENKMAKEQLKSTRFGADLTIEQLQERIFGLLEEKPVMELNLLLGELRLRKGVGSKNSRVIRPITAEAVLLFFKKGKRA